jgi:hypothetical protein
MMTDRAYTDIILKGKYSYRKFIADIDDIISKNVLKPKNKELIMDVIGALSEDKYLTYRDAQKTIFTE